VAGLPAWESHSPVQRGSIHTFETEQPLTGTGNKHASSSYAANFFNPFVALCPVSFSKRAEWSACRRHPATSASRKHRKIATSAFAQQAITTVTNTSSRYWELAFARENVKKVFFFGAQQQAVTVAQKLYEDNKKKLEIAACASGRTRAESEVLRPPDLIFAPDSAAAG